MQKPSDFVHAYLHSLTQKEQQKLRLLLKENDKTSELKLMDTLLTDINYNEPACIKKSGYTKSSFQKIKSDLKNYMLITSGYQARIVNQVVIERISIAQGLLRRGFIEEANNQFEKIIAETINAGQGLYAAIALGLQMWSIFFNQTTRITKAHPMLHRINELLNDELNMIPTCHFSVTISDLMLHDPGLKNDESRAAMKSLASNPYLTGNKFPSHVFEQYMILLATYSYLILLGRYAEAIACFEPVLQKRYGGNTNAKSQEILYIYELQCQSALLSHHRKLRDEYVARYVTYAGRWFVEDHAVQTRVFLFRCWEFIQEKDLSAAERLFERFLKGYAENHEQFIERDRYAFLYQAMLLSLNLDKTCREQLYRLVVQSHFNFEWNESYNTAFRLFQLFFLFDQTVVFQKGKVKIKNEQLHLQAQRTKDLFRKKDKGDYVFEIQLCHFFAALQNPIHATTVLNRLGKFSSKTMSEKALNKPYRKYYSCYFDFKQWADQLAVLLQ